MDFAVQRTIAHGHASPNAQRERSSRGSRQTAVLRLAISPVVGMCAAGFRSLRGVWTARTERGLVRYWDRTSDLCPVKVIGSLFEPAQHQVSWPLSLAPPGFSRLNSSRCPSTFPSVMWTRCGRDPGPQVSCTEMDRPQPTTWTARWKAH